MIQLLVIGVGLALACAIAFAAVGRVSAELGDTVAPALLVIPEAVEAVSETLPFEVSAVLRHADVERIIIWVLDHLDTIGLASEFGEELGGDWVIDEELVLDEVAAADAVVARGLAQRADLDPVHVTVVIDEFFSYLSDIGAVGGAA